MYINAYIYKVLCIYVCICVSSQLPVAYYPCLSNLLFITSYLAAQA